MNPEIFREYDIRGIAGKDMTDEEVYQLGRGIGTYLRRQGCTQLNVGRDCRVTSQAYAQQVINGLMANRLQCNRYRCLPHSGFYFSIAHLKQQGGVMITASP